MATFAAIKVNQEISHLHVIMFSAANKLEYIAEADHADGFLAKPSAMEMLQDIIRCCTF